MLKIRLSQIGKAHNHSYRIVVKETRSNRDGVYTDLLGHYNPSHNPPMLSIDMEKLQKWQSNGAQISTGLQRILDLKQTESKSEPKPKPKSKPAKTAKTN